MLGFKRYVHKVFDIKKMLHMSVREALRSANDSNGYIKVD